MTTKIEVNDAMCSAAVLAQARAVYIISRYDVRTFWIVDNLRPEGERILWSGDNRDECEQRLAMEKARVVLTEAMKFAEV